ncbi:MAG: bifunctional oligoribonuclease/PAP phosphatase NrnA [Candidatus Omnitrophica bacterium]|nr:bifunctional oligoribonuclease/PAP phosphatase NrnA [Candidatus Omnitrophota bacterium]
MSSPKYIWAEIKKHRRFLVTTHYNPDADAASSALAMAIVLRAMGKKAVVVNQDALPAWLRFLPKAQNFHKKTDLKQPLFDALIVLDCGDLERIGGVRQWLGDETIINIDHHVTNNFFGSVNLVYPRASSSCEILFDLFKAARVKLNKDLAALLYAGIMTDTGSFRYDNTNVKTHQIAATLMKFHLSAPDLYQRLYVGIPSVDMKGFVDVIHSAKLFLKNKVYCVMLPKKVMDSFSKKFDLKEKIFGFLRLVEGIEVVVILSELTPRQTRVNLRSQNHFDVAKLASQFNGGGHAKASGAKIEIGLEQAKKRILAAIRKSLL